MYCCDLSCTNGIVNKLKKKSVGTYALLHTQLQTLFHFYCSISGAHSLVNLNDLNFKKHRIFGCAYRNNMVLGIFESNCTCIVPLAFKQVYGLYRFYPILRDVWKTMKTCIS